MSKKPNKPGDTVAADRFLVGEREFRVRVKALAVDYSFRYKTEVEEARIVGGDLVWRGVGSDYVATRAGGLRRGRRLARRHARRFRE